MRDAMAIHMSQYELQITVTDFDNTITKIDIEVANCAMILFKYYSLALQ